MASNNIQPYYLNSYQLTAGEAGPLSRMPLTLVVERVIEVATEHANALNIGYARLLTHGIGWVLSRIKVEMVRYPLINEHYTVTTWIESYNRRFSERCCVMRDAQGLPLAFIHTTWCAIDIKNRTLADLQSLERDAFPCADAADCVVSRASRIAFSDEAGAERETYTFRYCDLDFNRHVNTVRYLDLILNHWPLQHYDARGVKHLDINFSHECYFGETVELVVENVGDVSTCELRRGATKAVAARIVWTDNQSLHH